VMGVKVNATLPDLTPTTIVIDATSRAAISIVRHNDNGTLPLRSVHCVSQVPEAHVLRPAALLYRQYQVGH
jgi:hypothetical protein